MKIYKKISAAVISVLTILLCVSPTNAADGGTVNITINTANSRKPISPYIYGINYELIENEVSCTAVRAGGNRYSAYNWETNSSNAGSDWQHSSDGYFQQFLSDELKNAYGGAALNLSEKCCEKNNSYSLMTLQMAGYVSADFRGAVREEETAPSARWNKVEFVKGTELTLEPDLNDGTVYMDEFVNYLVNTLGDSRSAGGIKGYSLDNEPSLWSGTHPRVHPKKTGCTEIVDKSRALAQAVKNIDPNAEIFGPALFGYGAYTNFADAPDWNNIKRGSEYRWFIDYYLDEMRKAEEETGRRLLDVLDVHFYTEARGTCGERYCDHYTDEGCFKAILDSTRSLWEEGYKENSWIVDTGAEFFPMLPNLQQSIDKYYPGTKLAITEYNFGGNNHICGAIAQADALGLFAKHNVYMAALFTGEADYQCAAIDLYTNYDGEGRGFGDTLVYCESDNIELSTAYAAINGDNDDVITFVVTNKSFSEKTTANIEINGDKDYSYVHVYGIDSSASVLSDITDTANVSISGNTLLYSMEPQTVSLLVIAKDESTAKRQNNNFSGMAWLIIGISAVIVTVCTIAVLKIKRKRRIKYNKVR